jgi:hypothetical protein
LWKNRGVIFYNERKRGRKGRSKEEMRLLFTDEIDVLFY